MIPRVLAGGADGRDFVDVAPLLLEKKFGEFMDTSVLACADIAGGAGTLRERSGNL